MQDVPQEFVPTRLEYDDKGAFIWAHFPSGEKSKFLDVRGHGFLASKIGHEQAKVIQDKWAEEVIKAWQAYSPK